MAVLSVWGACKFSQGLQELRVCVYVCVCVCVCLSVFFLCFVLRVLGVCESGCSHLVKWGLGSLGRIWQFWSWSSKLEPHLLKLRIRVWGLGFGRCPSPTHPKTCVCRDLNRTFRVQEVPLYPNAVTTRSRNPTQELGRWHTPSGVEEDLTQGLLLKDLSGPTVTKNPKP